MNLHKFYLQSHPAALDTAEQKYDFIPHLTSKAAANSLNMKCYLYTQEIAELKASRKECRRTERLLKKHRDYAFRNYVQEG